MYLGIDVGGTHTDAVVIQNGAVVASCKVSTNHDDLLSSVRGALERVLTTVKGEQISRLNLSTTLSTNAIVENKTEEVGVLVSAGPGLDPDYSHIGRNYFIIDGSIDHRGTEIKPLNESELQDAVAHCRESGLRAFAAVTKFSTRNPTHELQLKDELGEQADFISLGHRLSGILNFPRRVSTAYYNSAVWRIYNKFADAIEQSAREFGVNAPINILKADGGTMPLKLSRKLPVESILSGPAASVMGIIALCEIKQDAIILDIGGTTTDIALFAEGAPVIENGGIEVGSYPTLVRALKTHSIGIGGDSRLSIVDNKVQVGPEREGPPISQGGETLALMDALNFLGHSDAGNVSASKVGVENMAALWNMSPQKLAEQALEYALESIKHAVDDMIWTINQRPVYTIGELLSGQTLKPTRVYCMGGPAKAFQPLLQPRLKLDVEVPDDYAVANAIGAALTRTTTEIELIADTEKKTLFIPNLGIQETIDWKFDLEKAEATAKKYLSQLLCELNPNECELIKDAIDTIEADSFNMVNDYGASAKNIRVKCQIRPGVMK